MNEKEILYRSEEKTLKRLDEIKKSDINEKNKDLINKYHDYCKYSRKIDSNTNERYNYVLFRFAKCTKKCFLELSGDGDFTNLIKTMINNGRNTGEVSKGYYIQVLRNFYDYLRRYHGYTENYYVLEDSKQVKKKRFNSRKELPENEEVLKIIERASLRDKALFSIPNEIICRLGELLLLKIGDVTPFKDEEDNEFGAILRLITLKKRSREPVYREVPIVDSWPYLRDWLNEHNYYDPKNYVFVKENGEILKEAGARQAIRKLKEELGIKKRICFHAFRFKGANDSKYEEQRSIPLNQLPDIMGCNPANLENYFVQDYEKSNANYLKTRFGIKKDENIKKMTIKSKKCQCGEMLSPTNRICPKCNTPNDNYLIKKTEDYKMKHEAKRKWYEIIEKVSSNDENTPRLIEVANNPDVTAKFLEFINNGKL
jgi:site-specific recombinase XerD